MKYSWVAALEMAFEMYIVAKDQGVTFSGVASLKVQALVYDEATMKGIVDGSGMLEHHG